MKIEDIEDQLNRDDFSSQQVYELVTSLIRDKKAQKKKYERITDDDIERINVAGLLLSKSEVATTNQIMSFLTRTSMIGLAMFIPK